MVRAARALSVAAAAAALCAAGADAGRRRAKAADGGYISCVYDAADGEPRRFCVPHEAGDGGEGGPSPPAAACACRETCHAWAGVRLAPFHDACAADPGQPPGWTTLWELPARGGSPGMKIEVLFDQKRKDSFIRALRVDGDKVMDAMSACSSSGAPPVQAHRMLESDAALARNRDPDTKVAYSASCAWKKRYPYLEVSLTVEHLRQTSDSGDGGEGPFGWIDSDGPFSTAMFAEDSGLCVSPGAATDCDLGQSSLKASDGRECSCNAQCSLFDAGQVADFFTEQADGARTFAMPKLADAAPPLSAGRVLYMVDDKFAVYGTANACGHIEQVTILARKRSDDPGGQRCRLVGWDPEPAPLDPHDFDQVVYDARTACASDADFQAPSRKSLVFPFGAAEAQYLTAAVAGYDLGHYGTLDENDPIVRPFRAARLGGDVRQCELPWGGSAAVTSLLDMGGVRVTASCHRTAPRRQARSAPYFNICVERTGVADARTRASAAPLPAGALAAAERSLLSSGHCALGEATYLGGGPPWSSQHRPAGDFNYFSLADP